MTLDSLPNGQYTFADSGDYHITGINKIAVSKEQLKVYPNPSAGNFTVDVPPANMLQYLYVYDMQGKMVTRVKVGSGQTTCVLNGTSWRNGTYILSLWNGAKVVDSKNLVISH